MGAHFKTNLKIQNAPIRVSIHRIIINNHSQRGNLKDQHNKKITTATTTTIITQDDDSCPS